MKKILSVLLLGTMSIGAMAKTYYCDPASTITSGTASTWETAISPAQLRKNISGVRDTIYFKGGTILISQLSEVFTITKSLTFIGGFDPAATGKVTAMPTYPSPTPTIFSGDANKDGKPNKGDAPALIRVDYSSDTAHNKLVFRLIGCDLVNTFYEGEGDSPDDVLTSTAKSAALRVLCGTAYVRHCNFYNHITYDSRGSQCVTSVGAHLHIADCELHDCISLTRGSLLRSRQYFINSEASRPVNPDCVIERCAFYNGNNMAGETINTAGFYGGAIQISYGPVFAINTTIANNMGYSDGGGINTNESGATFISCTLANNMSTRAIDPNSDAPGTYGSNFHINKNGVVHIANTIVLGPYDNGSKQYTVLYSDQNSGAIDSTIISGGYNITGTYFYYRNGAEINDQSAAWLATDKYSTPKGDSAHIQHMATYMGANPQLTDEGGFSKVMKPLTMQDGDNVAHLQQLANSWCPQWTHVDASVDQRGYNRDATTTCVGAMAMEAQTPSALEDTQSSINNLQSTIYNILGQPVDANYEGIVIIQGKKYIVK